MLYKLRSLRTFVLFVLLAAVAGTGGCADNWTNDGSVFSLTLKFLEGKNTNQVAVGKDSPNIVAGHYLGSSNPNGQPVQPQVVSLVPQRPADASAETNPQEATSVVKEPEEEAVQRPEEFPEDSPDTDVPDSGDSFRERN